MPRAHRHYLAGQIWHLIYLTNTWLSEPPSGSETILVVEDEEMVRKLVCETLMMKGYRVLEAAKGERAMLISTEHQGPIHLLLSDVVMPEMSGPELATRLVSKRPATKVLYMSGYTEDAVVRGGVLDRGLAFIQKPFTPAALARKVHEVRGSPVLLCHFEFLKLNFLLPDFEASAKDQKSDSRIALVRRHSSRA